MAKEQERFTTRNFGYEQLSSPQQFRILTIFPGEGSDPILTRLETFSLNTAPKFEALSYHWGTDPSRAHSISVDASDLKVTNELHVALLHLRLPARPRKMWIDAICINQDDVTEKSQQVGIMRSIYQKARCTVIWLGPGTPESEKAFAMCDRMVTKYGNEYLKLSSGFDLRQVWQAAYEASRDGTEYRGPGKEFFDHAQQHYGTKAALNRKPKTPVETPTSHSELSTNLPPNVASETESNNDDSFQNTIQHQPDSSKENTSHTSLSPSDDGIDDSDSDTSPMRQAGKFFSRVLQRVLQQQATQSAEEVESPSLDEIVALRTVLKLPWFSRVWIIQEVSVCVYATLQCGSAKIDWYTFFIGFSTAAQMRKSMAFGPENLHNSSLLSTTKASFHAAAISASDHRQLELLRLLRKFRRFHATDPRDKVFALLGLSSTDLGSLDLRPDYSLDSVEVYKRLANTLLRNSDRLNIFSIPKGSSFVAKRLNSWMPDWNDSGPQRSWLLGDFRGDDSETAPYPVRRFTVSGTSIYHHTSSNSFGSLPLDGYALDTLQELGDVLTIEETKLEFSDFGHSAVTVQENLYWLEKSTAILAFVDVLKQWEEIGRINDLQTTYLTGEDHRSVYQKTLWTDLEPQNDQTGREEFEQWMQTVDHLRWVRKEFPPLRLDLFPSGDSEEIEEAVAERAARLTAEYNRYATIRGPQQRIHMFHRRLARTVKGYLALVPGVSREGDSIFLLKGGITPYLLRARGDDWELVGDIYVHSIMYGEAWDESLCYNVTLR